MVLNRFVVVAVVSGALGGETALGASHFSTSASTGVVVNLLDFANRNNPGGGGQAGDSDTDDVIANPVAAKANVAESWGRAFGDMTATATATVGDLGVKFLGNAQVSSIFDPPGFTTSSTISALAVAEWLDFGTIDSDFPVGPLIINGSLTLGNPLDRTIDGGFFGSVAAPPLAGYANGSFKIESLGNGAQFPAAPFPNGNWATLDVQPNNNINILNPAPTAITYRLIVDQDVSFTIGFRVTLRGEASAGLATTIFGGDFSGSLHWGGIQSVTDLAGNPIPNDHWRITSASGFDYSKPFSVPEPSSLVLAALGALGIVATGGRRFRAGRR